MDQNLPLNQNVDTLFHNLENFTQNEGLIGKPVTHEDKTFIPVISLAVGYGGGNTASKTPQGGNTASAMPGAAAGNMTGGALGLGARLHTEAIIVIDNNKVSMMQVSPSANASQLMDKLPQMLSGLNPAKQQGQNQNQQQNQQS